MRGRPLPLNRLGFEERLLRAKYPAYTEELLEVIDSAKHRPHELPKTFNLAFSRVSIDLRNNNANLAPKIDPILSFQDRLAILLDYVAAAELYIEELDKATDDDIQARYDELTVKRDLARSKKAEQDDRWLYHLKENEADFDYWRSIPAWTADEAVALSLGKDPRRITAEKLKPFRKVARSLFTEEYGRRLAVLERATAPDMLEAPFSPQKFINWADSHDIELDERFKESFCRDNFKSQNKSPENFQPESRQYKTLQTIILAMAIDKYQYSTDMRSSAPTLISKAFDKLKEQAQRNNENFATGGDHRETERFQAIERFYFDLSCSDTTIRKILTKAASEFSVVWPRRK